MSLFGSIFLAIANSSISTKFKLVSDIFIDFSVLIFLGVFNGFVLEIYLKNKFPVMLGYNVANLGKLQYCLAPLV